MVRLALVHRSKKVSGACWMLLAILLFWSCKVTLVGSTRPEPVEKCDATGQCELDYAYKIWYDRSPCKASSVVYPSTEQEIISAVADAVRGNRKIKVSTRYGHSLTKVACPGTSSGVILSSKNYTSIVDIDAQSGTVTAQGGIQLRTLVDKISTQGLALPVSPYWDGLTLAGLLSTGAHGSSLFGKGGAVHEYVIGMRLVTPATPEEGFATVRVLGSQDPDLNAAKVSLGVLGVISTVTLQLQPMFKRNLTLQVVKGDVGLEDETIRIANNVEFGDITWYPSLDQVVYRYDHRAPLDAPGEGINNFIGFQPQPLAVITGARLAEEAAESAQNRKLKCDLAFTLVTAEQAVGYGYKKNGLVFSGFPVIGRQNLIQTAGGCQTNDLPGFYCPWSLGTSGIFINEASAAIPLRNLIAFLHDIRDLQAKVPMSLCDLDLYNGILIRFVRKTDAYLGPAQEDAAMIDFSWSRGQYATTPRLDMDIYQEFEQLAFDKYGARPHWGKNRNYVFEGVGQKYANLNKFLDTKSRFDPKGYFSSEWSDALLGINSVGTPGVVTYAPFCAIDGLCRCQTDEHCAPKLNSFCRPGRVYPAARVCRME